jgi:hypothetical protein
MEGEADEICKTTKEHACKEARFIFMVSATNERQCTQLVQIVSSCSQVLTKRRHVVELATCVKVNDELSDVYEALEQYKLSLV